MSLKLKVAQKEMEEGDLKECRRRVQEMGFTCELSADWGSFKTEEECKKVYNYAFTDIESALSSGFQHDKLVQDTFNAAVKKIEVGVSDAETKMSLDGDIFKVLVNFDNNGFVQSSKVHEYLMDVL